ncbi:MAG: SRPBCC family protein [Planctomycetota bacterium]|nr:SRPBCC family protein [Planctomycetota bacterium]
MDIDPNVRKARGLPAAFYGGAAVHTWALERLFPGAWQPLPGECRDLAPGTARPWRLLPGGLDEPLLVTRESDGGLHCLSNVCTHRGALLLEDEVRSTPLRCRYHGRRFDAAGRCLGMPQMDGQPDFPADGDHLPALPLETWGPLTFTAPDPALDFASWLSGWADALPPDLDPTGWHYDASRSPTYEVDAAWTLYVDNYLEGLHIAHVHPELSRLLDRDAYETHLLPHGVLQVGTAKDGDTALYGWFFPNVMLNLYAWGLSVNVVEPLAPRRTRVRYLTFLRDPATPPSGPGGDLDLVERQDHAIVESAQRGVASRLYRRGTYVPGWEDGVHHFHRMLAARWNADRARG